MISLHPKPLMRTSATPSSPVRGKYYALRQAILQGKKGIGLYRRDFLDACIEYSDALRVRRRPQVDDLGSKILEDCGKLIPVRDHTTEIVIINIPKTPDPSFAVALAVTVPLFIAVTSPEELIVAIPEPFTIDQVTLLLVAFAGRTV